MPALQSKVVRIHRLQNGQTLATTVPPTDIVAIRGDNHPRFRSSTGLQLHPTSITAAHPSVLHVSRRQGEEILWQSDEPFTIARITEHDSPVEARPFPWDCPRRSVETNGVHIIASDVPVADADGGKPEGKMYKAWFKFDDEPELLDPDFNCNP